MIEIELRDWLSRNPFEPFCVELVTGRRINIFNPATTALLHERLFIADTTAGSRIVVPYQAIAILETIIEGFDEGAPVDADDDPGAAGS